MLPPPLVRAVLRCAAESEEDLTYNLKRLRTELRPEGVDASLLAYLGTTTERARQVPTLVQARSHFTALAAEGDGVAQAVLGRLDSLTGVEPFLAGVDFHHALTAYQEDVLSQGLGDLLIQTSQILTSGYTVTERAPSGKWAPVTYKGVDAALRHLARGTTTLRARTGHGAFADGDIRAEGDRLRAYIAERTERGTGVLSGFSLLDTAHRGLQPGELCLVMGFPGHMKTTLALNWAYHAVVHQGRNIAFVSLETPADILRAALFVMHAAHPKFRGRPRVEYDRVINGQLTAEENQFFAQVMGDFADCPAYGRFLYKEPSTAMTIEDIHAWAELKHHTTPLSLLVVDYLGLVDPDQKIFDRQQAGSGLNRVIRQAKLLAMSFAGTGIPVLSPHQANREGYAEAEKSGGRYKLAALANANEAERSTDVVYYTYLDDSLRASCELVVGNLKNRNGRVFTEQLRVYADPTSRLILDLNPYETAQGLVAL